MNDLNHTIGDYNNPILKPQAAEVVRKHGELALAGGYPTPSTQCSPAGVLYLLISQDIQMLQEPKQVTILYLHPFLEFRQVRINEPHRAPVEPSWYGDSVGHYEGDTLVIDTVGQKVGPYSMVDPYGTPFTAALHVVERYRLVDYKEAKEGLDSDAEWNSRFARVNPNNYLGKYLQLSLVIEDEEVFTTPWTATITYWRDPPTSAEATWWDEHICAESSHEYYGAHTHADNPDF